MSRCPVCWSNAKGPSYLEAGELWDCTRCGRYLLTGTAEGLLDARLERSPNLPSNLSYFIRRGQRSGKSVVVRSFDLDAIEREPQRSPAEMRDALLLWLGDNQPTAVTPAKVALPFIAATIGATKVLDARNAEDGFQWLASQLEPEKLFDFRYADDKVAFTLTMKGWSAYEEVRRRSVDSRTAFMAMKFGDSELNEMVNQHFRSAVDEAGFSLRLLTDGQGAGLIDNQIRAAIRTAAFVIADLTHDNNGAYFEAGFAEGIGLHVIYTCRADKFEAHKTHFDTNHMVTIPWSTSEPQKAAQALTNTVRATFPSVAKMV